MSNFVYTYALLSQKDEKFYIGCTDDLKVRFDLHTKGRVPSTKERLPLELIYWEACRDRKDARHRELYLKTTHGKAYLRKRVKLYLAGLAMHKNNPVK